MDIMIDIETMGLRPGSVIASIGAQVFDLKKRELVSDGGFYVVVDMADAQKQGLRIEAGTVAWWLRQSEAARQVLLVRGEWLSTALAQLTNHFRGHGCVNAWSHGAGFDLVLLDSAYYACGLEAPWKYPAARDTRTLYALAGINPKEFFDPNATAHNALDDARAQAKAVIAAYDKLFPLPVYSAESVPVVDARAALAGGHIVAAAQGN